MVIKRKKKGGLQRVADTGDTDNTAGAGDAESKWWWRFKTDHNSLWVKVITSIYGSGGGLNLTNNDSVFRGTSTWHNIIKAGTTLDSMGLEFSTSFIKELGNGNSVKFWQDEWIGDFKLMDQFSRLYALEYHKQASVCDTYGNNVFCGDWSRPIRGRAQGELTGLINFLAPIRLKDDEEDKWRWCLDAEGYYKTKTMSNLIDEKRSASANSTSGETLRNKAIPLKFEIFVWRARKKRIPVRIELVKRGIDLDSTLCPCCLNETQTVDHILLQCHKVVELWNLVLNWWNLSYTITLSLEQIFDNHSFIVAPKSNGKIIWQSLKWVTCYLIWKARNDVVFKNHSWMQQKILTDIQSFTFGWISKRLKKPSLEWHQWLINPGFFVSSTNIM
ncbi:uncharacterized protein [Rutidosis leptorrhynchoides]|uniref:uncharacterized protein n=1 Tax=Rutidosis leptorrhynchoides TaxID=125765 RepID=UPI003A98D784